MDSGWVLSPLVFGLTGGLILFVLRALGQSSRLDTRLRDLEQCDPNRARPAERIRLANRRLRQVPAALPPEADQRTLLQRRLVNAGHYHPGALNAYLFVKSVLLLAPWMIGPGLAALGLVPLLPGVFAGALSSSVGLVGPSLWLERQIRRRRAALRRGLPDVLDVLVLCLEGGLSLTAAFQLITLELRDSFPVLGFELRIVQREMELGRPLSQALRNFAERSGLEEVGVLASLVEQTERLGASLIRSLRVQCEQMRYRRTQHFEEQAQKAGSKILFPTLLFIFPAIFIILLGPAALRVKQVLDAGQLRSPAGTRPEGGKTGLGKLPGKPLRMPTR